MIRNIHKPKAYPSFRTKLYVITASFYFFYVGIVLSLPILFILSDFPYVLVKQRKGAKWEKHFYKLSSRRFRYGWFQYVLWNAYFRIKDDYVIFMIVEDSYLHKLNFLHVVSEHMVETIMIFLLIWRSISLMFFDLTVVLCAMFCVLWCSEHTFISHC